MSLSEPGGGNRPEIIAHRGYSARFPENTVPALLGALAWGCGSLEWDIRFAADGIPVLFHDETLERTSNGSGLLSRLTSAELSELDAGSWFSSTFRGTPIPTLQEALARIGSRAIRVYPEVKAVGGLPDLDTLLRILRSSGLHSRTTLLSLDHAILDEVRARDPELSLGWVVGREEELGPAADAVEADGKGLLDPDAALLLADPSRTRDLVARGIPIATWTVDDPAEAEALRELGILRITTNRVSHLLQWAEAS